MISTGLSLLLLLWSGTELACLREWKLSPWVELLWSPHWITALPVWSVPLVEAGLLLIVLVSASNAIATSASVSSVLIEPLLLMVL